ncbi:baseplate J/gp47 family protein [Pseudomonas sp. MWU13-2105]|uniref:baseplate J/gp47 family protein n=1 Tax=Pseudomonas sp. MWU13-2105 TaxID=2935074 RepID=UPI00200DAA31|nr:baseplate J/gp47 family protein [Pseudomonas sp. MWU13-2105]
MEVDRHNARMALAGALDPDSCKVDERSHRDRLAFAADFAALVVYYDKNNQVAGDWRQFFLKDPAILMAAISKADPGSYYSTFSPTMFVPVAGLIGTVAKDAGELDPGEIAQASQLCMLIGNMFVLLNQWFYFITQAAGAHVLRAFLKARIEGALAEQLGNMVALQQALSSQYQGQIAPPDIRQFNGFEPVWQASKGDSAARYALGVMSPVEKYEKLKQIYGQVYSVFTQVVEYAQQAFLDCESKPTRYPDTALLMAFSRLMEVQQSEINGLGRKHLDFYYEQVLQQTLRPAQVDQVYVCLGLSPKAELYQLPAGTPFKAGSYADGSDIVFVNDQAEQFNHATLVQLNALFYADKGPAAGLYLSTPADVGNLLLADGQGLCGWDAFGNAEGIAVQQGFALASPMLLLQGGTRSIRVELGFDQTGSSTPVLLATGARYFLSTAKAWMEVLPSQPVSAALGGLMTLQFELKPGDPAILAFTSAMDGLSSPWPMLKVVLGATQALNQPPALERVSISVRVDGSSQLVMASDTALLPTTGTIQPFGPVPALGQSLYVGSNEWFSKPLSELTLTLQWDNLPADLADYYAAFNDYLASTTADAVALFSNVSFKVDWDLLCAGSWAPLSARSPAGTADGSPRTALFQQPGPAAGQPASPASQINATSSSFSFGLAGGAFTPAPELTLAPLPAVRQARDGYIRLQLAEPAFAFGHSLYAKVVASVSLLNAQALIRQAQVKPDSLPTRVGKTLKLAASAVGNLGKRLFGKPVVAATPAAADAPLEMPNLPLSPAQRGILASYAASTSVDISRSAVGASYPLRFYHYGSFMPCLAYDAQYPQQAAGFAQLTPQAPPGSADRLPLYPGVAGAGGLYLALGNVTAPGSLTLLLGILTDEQRAIAADATVTCYYWTANGWSRLEVLQDSTGNLSRSGIIKLEIPAEAGAAAPGMPSEDFWLAIAAPAERRTIRLTYVNTQALKLRRSSVAALAAGEIPRIAANVITSTQHKISQLASVVQPFASSGGRAVEDKAGFEQSNSFYRRVSTRLNHKDRASSRGNYVDMAHEVCPELYYATQLEAAGQPGSVSLGLVKGYANALHPDAFTPRVSATDQLALLQHLERRSSAMARIRIQNLAHQTVRIDATLVLSPGVNATALTKELNQRLRLYLSPWIASDLPQMDIAKGLSRSELARVIGAYANVLAVSSLQLWLTPVGQAADRAVISKDDPLLPDPGAILVTAARHTLAALPRQADAEVSHG